MDYVNFYVTMPEHAYLKLEDMARLKRVTKNEIILNIILSRINPHRADLDPIKNAGFDNRYNEFYGR